MKKMLNEDVVIIWI